MKKTLRNYIYTHCIVLMAVFTYSIEAQSINSVAEILKDIETVCIKADGSIEAAGFAVQEQAKQLISIWDVASSQIIVELEDRNKNFVYRYLLCEVLGFTKENKAFNVLKNILENKSENEMLRHRAARSIGRIGDKRAVQSLIIALDDKNHFVRMGAAKGLGMLKASEATDKLIQKLQHDNENKEVSMRICYALSRIKGSKSIDAMINLLSHNDPSYRYAGVRALGRIGDSKATISLINLLKKDKSIRKGEIIDALGKIGDKRAIESLIEEIKSNDPLSVGKAAEALLHLRATGAIQYLIKAESIKRNKNSFTIRKLKKAIDELSKIRKNTND